VTSATSSPGDADLYAVYAGELRGHAIDLVWLGYLRLNIASLTNAHEDVVTGELVKEMNSVLEDPEAAPPWAEHYSVTEQQRLNVLDKLGKTRPIIDVEFERHCRGKRPRLRFEAKRLRRATGVGAYLGEEGLAAFLDGYYPVTHPDAGMLGYVHEEAPADWAEKLSIELMSDAKKHRVSADGQWIALPVSSVGAPSFRSVHADVNNNTLAITHVLLAFTN